MRFSTAIQDSLNRRPSRRNIVDGDWIQKINKALQGLPLDPLEMQIIVSSELDEQIMKIVDLAVTERRNECAREFCGGPSDPDPVVPGKRRRRKEKEGEERAREFEEERNQGSPHRTNREEDTDDREGYWQAKSLNF
ncbi:hypothetical protein PsorP6_006054 [Peronosclerospora sorghi]|uniref:Uncharacterized protein n=1 Tax=Peronosclerospora sorghi TaxID=230839 RepID=A0ACC0W6L8_9STRA|nr:hypothetical protein PsorP6_006054 [Peronosclerospora sorghi]